MEERNFCLENVDGSISLKRNHAYYYQIQLQMKICEVEYCDFVVWGDESVFYERILIDTEFIDNAIEEAQPFIKLALLPELVGKWFSRQTVATTTLTDPPSSSSNDNPPTTSSSNDSAPTTSSSNDSAPTTPSSNDSPPTTSSSNNTCSTTPSTTDTCDSNTEVWCFCKQGESYGEMIGCDNPQCTIQWFYLFCSKLEQHQIPRGKWLPLKQEN